MSAAEEPRRADRVYLFIPSRRWAYCGGATLICERSAEDAVSLGNCLWRKYEEDGWSRDQEISNVAQFILSEDDPNRVPAGRGDYAWVLVREFRLAEPEPCGVVFSDSNYA